MAETSVSWLPRTILTLLLLTQQGSTDCELCQSVESGTYSVLFEIDGIGLNNGNETADLNSFVRMRIEKELVRRFDDDQDPWLNLTVNDERGSYRGCYSATEKQLITHMGDVDVAFMKRSLISRSDRCIGYRQLSVRLARLPKKSLQLEDNSTVNVQWQGPSKVKEVCVGMEGGNCTIHGNGESHRRCFVRPSMPDNCEVTTLHDDDTVVVTSGVGFVSNQVLDAYYKYGMTVLDYSHVYIGSIYKFISLSVVNIQRWTKIELMMDILKCYPICSTLKNFLPKSNHSLSVVNTADTSLSFAGFGRQFAHVSAAGNTSISGLILNTYRKNRITVNARCSEGLNLRFFIQGRTGGYDYWRQWLLRVGCPDDPSKECTITDLGKSRAKQVIIATREAWLDDLIDVTGNRLNSFVSAFAAFYKSERSEKCCHEICDFKKHCPLANPDGGRSFTYDDFCNSFVLSFYVPFVHIITAVVYLICVGSLLMLVSRDDRIQSSRNIKYITLSLSHSALFSVTWIVITVIEAFQYGDMFQDISQTRRGLRRWPFTLLTPLILSAHLIIASDFRWLHFAMLNEIHDKVLIEKCTESWTVNQGKADLFLYGWGSKLVGWSIALMIMFFIRSVLIGVYFLFYGLFLGLPIFLLAFIWTFKSFPDMGFLFGVSWIGILYFDGVLSWSLILTIAVVIAHVWNFLLVWALVLQFAYGERVMMNAKKAALYLLIQSMKITRMFTQILDVFTDWIIIAFFFADGWILFGLTESTFVLSAAMVSAYYEWDSFPYWWQRMITLMGLGRIIQVIDNSVSNETRTFLSEIEVHLESLPSVLFGMLIVLTTPREDSGPVLFSMSVTWFSLFLRAFGVVIKPKMPVVWKGLIFLTLLTDFFVRCVSPALIIAIIQGQQGSEYPRVGSILFFLSYFVSVLAAYLVYYWNFYSGAVSRSPFYLRAMISTISVRCALFAYLRMDHYKHDAVIATPLDLAVLTIPHCCISLLFSSISIAYSWTVFPGLSIVSVLFTLIQMGCVTAMCNLSKDEFISVDADQLQSKEKPPAKHEVVTSMSDVLSPVEDNPDSSAVNTL